MNITRYTDYSLRVLIYLAVNDGQQAKISDIAESYQISKNHLMKIVQELNIRGYLLATRGKNGGLRLNRSPADINVGELVREVEDATKMAECFGRQNQCVITPSCQLKRVFAEAQENFFKTLDRYTLSDLVGEPHRKSLFDLLAIQVE
jgi:Rrf2 family transcriptional regulator, nitric oxide-sensitive transcriptional repressor